MLRFETEFITSDLIFSKWDDKGLIGLSSDTYETKYVGQLSYWRRSSTGGAMDEIQSIGMPTGGTAIIESSKYSAFLFTGHTDPVLRLWTKKNLQKPIKRYTFHNMSIEDLNSSPFDGEEFVSCSKDSSFAVWTMTDSEPLYSFTNESSYPLLGVSYHSQNPSILLAAPLDSKIEIYNSVERKKVYTIIPPDDQIFSSMSINPFNEFMLSVADETGRIFLWDMRKLNKPVNYWQAHSLAIPRIRFNPHDEQLLGTCGTDSYFHLWYTSEAKKIQCLKSFKTHNLPITCWDWSVHELGLVGDASSDYSIFLWNCIKQ